MNNYQRTHSPFEDSAAERLRRMGLTAADGSPERDATFGFDLLVIALAGLVYGRKPPFVTILTVLAIIIFIL